MKLINRIKDDYLSVLVAIVFSSYYCVVLPLQSRIINPVSFGFGLLPLFGELFILWVIVVSIVWVLLYSSWKMRSSRLLHLFLLALVFLCYLESGILSYGIPPLDGDYHYFNDARRGILDASILLVVLCVVWLFRRRLVKKLHWISWGLFVLVVSSLLDARQSEVAVQINRSDFSNGFAPKSTVAKSVKYSARRNVFVFILDSVTTELALDVFENERGIKESFRGFTLYRNNVGQHSNTLLAEPSILTGEFYDGKCGIGEHLASCFSRRSCLWDYKLTKVPMSVLLGCYEQFGYTDFLGTSKSVESDNLIRDRTPLVLRRAHGLQKWNLLELTIFRIVPFSLKNITLKIVHRLWRENQSIGNEKYLYPYLAEAAIDNALANALHIYHTDGAHYPLTVDRFGNSCQERDDYEGAYEKCVYSLSSLAKLLDVFKRRRIFDSSVIIVLADHGGWGRSLDRIKVQKLGLMSPRMFPMLAVKPIGSMAAFKCSDLPVSHAKLSKLIGKSCTYDCSESEVNDILETSGERLYFDKSQTGADWYLWRIDAYGKGSREPFSPMVDPLLLPVIKLDYAYAFQTCKSEGSTSYPPVGFDDVDDSYMQSPVFSKQRANMYFRVSDCARKYAIELFLRTRERDIVKNPLMNGEDEDQVLVVNGIDYRFDYGETKRINIFELKPDDRGVIKIGFERKGLCAWVQFDSMRVSCLKK